MSKSIKNKNDTALGISADEIGIPLQRGPEEPGALSLVSFGFTFFQFFQHLHEQKIPDDAQAQAISAWRWSIRAPSC